MSSRIFGGGSGMKFAATSTHSSNSKLFVLEILLGRVKFRRSGQQAAENSQNFSTEKILASLTPQTSTKTQTNLQNLVLATFPEKDAGAISLL